MADLQQRHKGLNVSRSKDEENYNVDDIEINTSLAVERKKVEFLQSNVNQLTEVHKRLVRDNCDLRNELPAIEKRYRNAMERVKLLEVNLKQARNASMAQKKKYQQEVERIKEAVKKRNIGSDVRMNANIVKSVRAGQHLRK
ncbi:hypothetical protein SNEBB_006465 [Seison nebaliae]|nr:hypothetical protein SNEBB_006465 [Seison nebaliae]